MSARDETYAAKAPEHRRANVAPADSDIAPRQVLSSIDVIAIIVGLVIGAGIFKAPAVVAANTSSEWMFIATWVLGGFISLTGALCYAELASAYPSAGGEYHFLTRAYGKRIAFLFAWSRLAVLQTGSIALLAFVLGDYLSTLVPLGAHGSAIYAAVAVVALTALNITGLRASAAVQRTATLITLGGLATIIIAGLLAHPAASATAAASVTTASATPAFGLAMVFVLLTYGGWNESAYVSAELRDVRRKMAPVLVTAIVLITLVYVLANLAFLNVLGLEGIRNSQVIASDAMRIALGDVGAYLVTALIVVAVLDSVHMSILTGARTNYAMAADVPLFRFLGGWDRGANAPINALVTQGAITLILVLIGTLSRSGFETMVNYVSPVFWLFFLLTTLSLFVLRRREPDHPRPFRVPLYPLTPLAFSAACGYMLYSSLAYTGFGALLGVAVLLAGAPLLFFLNGRSAHRR
jgi:basic amino acid/polyamine antiporter, APA family